MQGCTLSPVDRAADLGSYARPEAVKFWTACLEFFREHDAASIRGTPAEIAATVGYFGEAEAAICALADLALSTVVVQAFDADHPAGRWLEIEDASRIAEMQVTILSTVALAEKRAQDQRRRRAASYREGRESERCSPRSTCWKNADRARPKQGELFDRMGDAPREGRASDFPQNVGSNEARDARCHQRNVLFDSSSPQKKDVTLPRRSKPRAPRGAKGRDDIGSWTPEAKDNVKRIANTMLMALRSKGKPVEHAGAFGTKGSLNRRCLVGVAALIVQGKQGLHEKYAVELATKAAEKDNPASWFWGAYRDGFYQLSGLDFNRVLGTLRIPASF